MGWFLIDMLKLFCLNRRCIIRRARDVGLATEVCAICVSPFRASDSVRTLPCPAAGSRGHTFHAACIDQWLLSEARCPLCNADCSAEIEFSPSVYFHVAYAAE